MNKIYDLTFKHPSRILITGPSGSGKTTFVQKLLNNMTEMFGFNFDRIIYCSGQSFPENDYINGIEIEKFTKFDEDILNDINPNIKNIIILDDNMHSSVNDLLISDLFTKKSHHLNITVILILQNLFPKSKYIRDISSNSTYLVLMSNPRETLQIKTLSSQIDGNHSNHIFNCFNDATKNKPFSYLLLDFDQKTPDELRVRTNVFPEEEPQIVYFKV